MTATEKHKENINLYLQLGGLDRLAKLHALPNLQNRARIVYLLEELKKSPKPHAPNLNQEPSPQPQRGLNDSEKRIDELENENEELQEENENLKYENEDLQDENEQLREEKEKLISRPKILGLIAEYPIELHESYRTAYENWIAVCSLKIQLNALPPKAEEKAFAIQTEMMAKMQIFDRCREALDYYKQFKRILPTETKEDLTELTPLELLKRKSNISGLISRRKQTIAKMESQLPEPTDKDFRKKVASINLKKEQLQEMILEEEKLIELIK